MSSVRPHRMIARRFYRPHGFLLESGSVAVCTRDHMIIQNQSCGHVSGKSFSRKFLRCQFLFDAREDENARISNFWQISFFFINFHNCCILFLSISLECMTRRHVWIYQGYVPYSVHHHTSTEAVLYYR